MSGLAKTIISPIGALIGGIMGKPKAQPSAMPAPLPQITPRANAQVGDVLSRRMGSRANQRTGMGGAESAAAPKKRLMGE